MLDVTNIYVLFSFSKWQKKKSSHAMHCAINLSFQLKEEIFVSGSEEEADYPPDGDSDEDLSDMDHKEIHDEVGTRPLSFSFLPKKTFLPHDTAFLDFSVVQ